MTRTPPHRPCRRPAGGRLALILAAGLAAAPLPAQPPPDAWGPLTLLGREIPPGGRERLSYQVLTSFLDSLLDTRVVALRGRTAGPLFCVVAGLHPTALDGVEIARRLAAETDPQTLAGTLLVVPMLNAAALRSGSDVLPGGGTLADAFPGDAEGDAAARIAHALFTPVLQPCDALVELRSGPASERVLPRVRADLDNPEALALARALGTAVLGGGAPAGSLQRAARHAGTLAIAYEAGQPGAFAEAEIQRGVAALGHAMGHLGMRRPVADAAEAPVFAQTHWLRATGEGGIFLTTREPGEVVRTGEVLGTITNPDSEGRADVRAPRAGRLLAVARPRIVLPGTPLFQLGSAP